MQVASRTWTRALGLVGHRGRAAARAYTNLGWAYAIIGDIAKAHRASEEEVARGEQEGDVQERVVREGKSRQIRCMRSAGGTRRSTSSTPTNRRLKVRGTSLPMRAPGRALIAVARDRPDAALEELRDVVSLARPTMDAQAVWPMLVGLSRVARMRGLCDEAEATLGELTSSIAATESAGDPQEWHVELVLRARRRRSLVEDATRVVERLAPWVWRDACAAVLEGDA